MLGCPEDIHPHLEEPLKRCSFITSDTKICWGLRLESPDSRRYGDLGLPLVNKLSSLRPRESRPCNPLGLKVTSRNCLCGFIE